MRALLPGRESRGVGAEAIQGYDDLSVMIRLHMELIATRDRDQRKLSMRSIRVLESLIQDYIHVSLHDCTQKVVHHLNFKDQGSNFYEQEGLEPSQLLSQST